MNNATIQKLARQSEKAAKIVIRNRFLIETYLSARESIEEKSRPYKNSRELFKKLGI